ncbi:MAG: Rieske 2Fe-2S domain-containing protein [Acetobacteraceae bacterium]|nr:Rieske 2Fe-2S domain-containing protein [Acetobacteraceae bacterium]
MSKDALANFLERQQWLGALEEPVQQGVRKAFSDVAGQPVRNALHGTWLGHPVHVVLTDVPIGSWTAAIVFDALSMSGSRKPLEYAAEASITVGLLGAVASAVTGLNDWAEVDGKPRRVGLMHGLLNLGAASLFLGSLIARKRRSRSSGKGLAVLGYVLATAAAKLGGTLVYEHRLGVDHSCEQPLPNDFLPVMNDSDLPENKPTRATANGTHVLLVKQNGRVLALAETCSHLGGPLSEGKLEDCTIRCPWHGSRFSLETGEVIDGPAVHPQTRLDATIRDGNIEVRMARP